MSEQLEKASWREWIMYCLGGRRAFLVEGDSMTPTINSDDVVLVRPLAIYSIGDIVLANHPYRSSVKILKRITQIDPNGAVHLLGDNPSESTDSRTFGAISIESIIGKVVCRWK